MPYSHKFYLIIRSTSTNTSHNFVGFFSCCLSLKAEVFQILILIYNRFEFEFLTQNMKDENLHLFDNAIS